MLSGGGRFLDHRLQQLDRLLADLIKGLVHGGQGSVGEGSLLVIVEAGEGNVIRNPEPRLLGGTHGPEGDHVRGAGDRRGALGRGKGKHLLHAFLAIIQGESPVAHQGRVFRQIGRASCRERV